MTNTKWFVVCVRWDYRGYLIEVCALSILGFRGFPELDISLLSLFLLHLYVVTNILNLNLFFFLIRIHGRHFMNFIH